MFIYIDPGTGSMLFTILLGLITTGVFFMQNLRIRLKQMIRGGRTAVADQTKIPYVIFSDHKRYWNVFQPICELFEAHRIPLKYWTCSDDDPGLTADYQYVTCEYIGEINRASARLNAMNAGVCISTTPGLDVYQWKRSKKTDYYVHICHSTWDLSGYRMFGLDFYDAILVNGLVFEPQVRKLEALRHLPAKDVREVGLTYMDGMMERLERISATEMAADTHSHETTVLLAPTWGPYSLLVKFGETIINALIATGYRIIIRPHPQSLTSDKKIIDRLREQFPDGEKLQWNFDNDNFNVLRQSDIMVSDFSGVIYDYVFVFDKPMIYADTYFQRDVYDASWLDEELWCFETLPRIGVHLEESMLGDMKKVIDDALNAEGLKAGRRRARDEAWTHRGESAKLIFNYVTDKSQSLENTKTIA